MAFVREKRDAILKGFENCYSCEQLLDFFSLYFQKFERSCCLRVVIGLGYLKETCTWIRFICQMSLSVFQRARTFQNMQDSSHNKELSYPNVNSAKIENPWVSPQITMQNFVPKRDFWLRTVYFCFALCFFLKWHLEILKDIYPLELHVNNWELPNLIDFMQGFLPRQ